MLMANLLHYKLQTDIPIVITQNISLLQASNKNKNNIKVVMIPAINISNLKVGSSRYHDERSDIDS